MSYKQRTNNKKTKVILTSCDTTAVKGCDGSLDGTNNTLMLNESVGFILLRKMFEGASLQNHAPYASSHL